MLRPKLPNQRSTQLVPVEGRSFGPDKRVKKRATFLEIQNTGRKFRTKSLLVCFLKAENRKDQTVSKTRLGVTITTKVHKRAVRRNRTKRLVREIFRSRYADFRKQGDLVVILLAGGVDRTYSELYEEFDLALNKLCII